MRTRVLGSVTGRLRSNTAFTSVKMAALAPIPRASVRMTVMVKPGVLRNWRNPYVRSWIKTLMQPSLHNGVLHRTAHCMASADQSTMLDCRYIPIPRGPPKQRGVGYRASTLVHRLRGWHRVQSLLLPSKAWKCKLEVLPNGDLNLRCGIEQLLRFDNAGTGRGEEGTYECGAWYIDDMPFAERTSLLERESACQRKMG